MLRDFIHTFDTPLVKQTLAEFKLDTIGSEDTTITLLEFRVITPDSFIWKLLINRTLYYLYAEDFVGGLDDIRYKLNRISKHPSHLEFIEAKLHEKFDDTEPVRGAAFYARPKNEEEMMKFTVASGRDFVFLCRSDEDGEEAYFNP